MQYDYPPTTVGASLGQAQTLNAPPQPGIVSAMKELFEAAYQLRNTSDNLRSSLGISIPQQNSKEPSEPIGLRDGLMRVVQVLRAANDDASECLRHLNS